MGESNRGIGLFGGSFDPVHNGHLAIAESFLQSGFISELWILLTPDPPHKKHQPLTKYNIRLKMLRAAFGDMEGVLISDIENRLPRPSFTVQTVKFLREKYPDHRFYLCVGEDSVKNFTSWHRWRELLENCELLIAQRPNHEVTLLDEQIENRAHRIEHQPIEISSTRIRHKFALGEDISNLIPEAVEQIIQKHNLYKNNEL